MCFIGPSFGRREGRLRVVGFGGLLTQIPDFVRQVRGLHVGYKTRVANATLCNRELHSGPGTFL